MNNNRKRSAENKEIGRHVEIKKSQECVNDTKLRGDIYKMDENIINLIVEFLDYDDVIRMASTCSHVRIGCENTMTFIRKLFGGFIGQGCSIMNKYTIRSILDLDNFCDEYDYESNWCYNNEGSYLSNAKAELQNRMHRRYRGVMVRIVNNADKWGSEGGFEFYVAGLCFVSPNFGQYWCFETRKYQKDKQWKKYERDILGLKNVDEDDVDYCVYTHIINHVMNGTGEKKVRMIRTMSYIRLTEIMGTEEKKVDK